MVLLTPERQRLLIALGRIVMGMGSLETQVVIAITTVARMNYGACQSLVAGENLESLFKMLDSIFAYEVRDGFLKEQFLVILKQLRDVNDRRNQYLHSHLMFTDGADVIKSKFTKGKKGTPLHWKPHSVPIEDFEKLSDDINGAASSLSALISNHSAYFAQPKY